MEDRSALQCGAAVRRRTALLLEPHATSSLPDTALAHTTAPGPNPPASVCLACIRWDTESRPVPQTLQHLPARRSPAVNCAPAGPEPREFRGAFQNRDRAPVRVE